MFFLLVLDELLAHLFDDLWEVLHFELVFFSCDVVGCVGGEDGRAVLCDDFSLVVLRCDPMDGHACFCFAGCFDGFVDVVSIHAFSAELGQQCGMEVDDAAWVGVDEEGGYHEEEAGQDDEVDLVVAEQGQEFVGVVEIGFGQYGGGYA